MKIAHGFDHREGASRERAARPACDSVPDVDVEAAEAVRAIGETGAGHRIRHESHPTRGSAPDDTRCLGSEVYAVQDDLDDHVISREGGAGDAWISMAERAHRVEEMRHASHSGVEREVGLVGSCVRVTTRDDDFASQQALDQCVGAYELGCQCDQAHRPGLQQAFEQPLVRLSASGIRVDPEAQR